MNEIVENPAVLNQSSYKTYQNCQRLYGWIRIQRLEPPDRKSAPEIGIAVHEALRIAHGEGGTVEAGIEAANSILAERTGPKLAFADKSLEASQDIVKRVLPAYFEYWRDRGELWSPIDQEVQFLVEVQPGWWELVFETAGAENWSKEQLFAALSALPRTGIYIRGRADNLSIHAGGLWLVDYKTAGKMDPRDLMKYEMDIQLTLYIYAITKHLTIESLREGQDPIEVRGAIIDLLVKTQTPQFARETFTRSIAEMAEFELEFIEVADRIRAQQLRVTNGEDWKIVFPKSTEHCFRYGTCAFRDLCLSDKPVRRSAYNVKGPDYVDEAIILLTTGKEAHESEEAKAGSEAAEEAKDETAVASKP